MYHQSAFATHGNDNDDSDEDENVPSFLRGIKESVVKDTEMVKASSLMEPMKVKERNSVLMANTLSLIVDNQKLRKKGQTSTTKAKAKAKQANKSKSESKIFENERSIILINPKLSNHIYYLTNESTDSNNPYNITICSRIFNHMNENQNPNINKNECAYSVCFNVKTILGKMESTIKKELHVDVTKRTWNQTEIGVMTNPKNETFQKGDEEEENDLTMSSFEFTNPIFTMLGPEKSANVGIEPTCTIGYYDMLSFYANMCIPIEVNHVDEVIHQWIGNQHPLNSTIGSANVMIEIVKTSILEHMYRAVSADNATDEYGSTGYELSNENKWNSIKQKSYQILSRVASKIGNLAKVFASFIGKSFQHIIKNLPSWMHFMINHPILSSVVAMIAKLIVVCVCLYSTGIDPDDAIKILKQMFVRTIDTPIITFFFSALSCIYELVSLWMGASLLSSWTSYAYGALAAVGVPTPMANHMGLSKTTRCFKNVLLRFGSKVSSFFMLALESIPGLKTLFGYLGGFVGISQLIHSSEQSREQLNSGFNTFYSMFPLGLDMDSNSISPYEQWVEKSTGSALQVMNEKTLYMKVGAYFFSKYAASMLFYCFLQVVPPKVVVRFLKTIAIILKLLVASGNSLHAVGVSSITTAALAGIGVVASMFAAPVVVVPATAAAAATLATGTAAGTLTTAAVVNGVGSSYSFMHDQTNGAFGTWQLLESLIDVFGVYVESGLEFYVVLLEMMNNSIWSYRNNIAPLCAVYEIIVLIIETMPCLLRKIANLWSGKVEETNCCLNIIAVKEITREIDSLKESEKKAIEKEKDATRRLNGKPEEELPLWLKVGSYVGSGIISAYLDD